MPKSSLSTPLPEWILALKNTEGIEAMQRHMQTYGFALSQIEIEEEIATVRDVQEETSRIKDYRNYYKGIQSVALSDKTKKLLENLLGHTFADNVCFQIVNEAAGKLILLEYSSDKKSVKKFVDSFLRKSGLSYKQAAVVVNTLRDGNFAVAVNYSEKRKFPHIYLEDWWDGKEGVFIFYDAEEFPYMAVKEYQVSANRYRRIVWEEYCVRKYVSSDRQTWEQDSFSLWVKKDSRPLHIPYVHFANVGKLENLYGLSELSGGVLGFQDQLNDNQFSLALSSRFTAFQQYWASGIDPTAEVLAEAGAFHKVSDPQGKFGVLPAGDLSQIINAYEVKLRRVCQMTQTPYHTISGGDWPSGDALIRAEQPSINKAYSQLNRIKLCFESIAHKAIEIQNAFGSEQRSLDEEADISASMLDPERRDTVSRSLIIHNLEGKVSIRESLRILGYDSARIDSILREMGEEKELRNALKDIDSQGSRGDENNANKQINDRLNRENSL